MHLASRSAPARFSAIAQRTAGFISRVWQSWRANYSLPRPETRRRLEIKDAAAPVWLRRLRADVLQLSARPLPMSALQRRPNPPMKPKSKSSAVAWREPQKRTSRWDESTSADSLCWQMNEFRQETLNWLQKFQDGKVCQSFFFIHSSIKEYCVVKFLQSYNDWRC